MEGRKWIDMAKAQTEGCVSATEWWGGGKGVKSKNIRRNVGMWVWSGKKEEKRGDREHLVILIAKPKKHTSLSINHICPIDNCTAKIISIQRTNNKHKKRSIYILDPYASVFAWEEVEKCDLFLLSTVGGIVRCNTGKMVWLRCVMAKKRAITTLCVGA